MSRGVTLAGYAVLVVTAVAMEAVARRRDTATLGDTLTRALRRPSFRVLLVAAWLWLGWHLFVRVD